LHLRFICWPKDIHRR